MLKEVPGPADPTKNYSYKNAAPLFAEEITAQQVKRWVDRGWLPFVQLPRKRVIKGSDINEFLAGRRVAASK